MRAAASVYRATFASDRVVFTRRDGTIHHFWSAEMGMETADPGQDPRGAPDPMPLWTLLDMTPEGRGKDWYPKLQYD